MLLPKEEKRRKKEQVVAGIQSMEVLNWSYPPIKREGGREDTQYSPAAV